VLKNHTLHLVVIESCSLVLERKGGFRVQHRLTDEWLPFTESQFQDLLTVALANTLQAFPRCSWTWRRYFRFVSLAILGFYNSTGPKRD
jgi:hypothetical protein